MYYTTCDSSTRTTLYHLVYSIELGEVILSTFALFFAVALRSPQLQRNVCYAYEIPCRPRVLYYSPSASACISYRFRALLAHLRRHI